MGRILIVDDQSLILMTIHEALKNTKHQIVDEANSGEESVVKARKYKPDLILMDINMPGKIDGIEAAKIINQELKIPVIFITAYSNENYLKQIKEISSYGYIVKPFQKYQLEMSIEIALYRNKMEKFLQKSIKKQKEKIMQERIIYYLLSESSKVLNPMEKMQETLNFICQYMDFKMIFIYRYNDNKITRLFESNIEEENLSLDSAVNMIDLDAKILELIKKPALFNDLRPFPQFLKDFFEKNKVLSLLSLPIYLNQDLKGIIVFLNQKPNYHYLYRFLKIVANIISMIFKRDEDFVQIQLHEKEKLEREKMLFELQRLASLGELSSAINHEISQPLQSIKVLSDSVLFWDQENKKPEYETMLNNFRKISARVEKVDKIIKNMNMLFKSPDKIELEDTLINLVIISVTSIFEEKLKKNHIQLILSLDEKIKEIPSSPIQIQQIVSNLIKNAINALIRSGKPNKKIIIQTLEKGDHIIIRVSDNGNGIPDEIQKKIFNPFFSTFQESSSMGMGLYIVQNILKSLNSEIEVYNNADGGAVFTIKLTRMKKKE